MRNFFSMIAALLLASSIALPTGLWALTPIPPLTEPVSDQAHILSAEAITFLNRELQQLWQSGGSQIAVLTVPQLEGETIEGLTIRVAETWKLGTKDRDNGVLLAIALQDRRMRIEVGQGLEGELPDALAGRIVDQQLKPAFRAGDFNQGVVDAVIAIAARTDPSYTFSTAGAKSQRGHGRSPSKFSFLFQFLLVIFIAFFAIRRRIFGSGFGGGFGGFGGGGFGGGGGGGGFGGGGGGFSGGGSSGGW